MYNIVPGGLGISDVVLFLEVSVSRTLFCSWRSRYLGHCFVLGGHGISDVISVPGSEATWASSSYLIQTNAKAQQPECSTKGAQVIQGQEAPGLKVSPQCFSKGALVILPQATTGLVLIPQGQGGTKRAQLT